MSLPSDYLAAALRKIPRPILVLRMSETSLQQPSGHRRRTHFQAGFRSSKWSGIPWDGNHQVQASTTARSLTALTNLSGASSVKLRNSATSSAGCVSVQTRRTFMSSASRRPGRFASALALLGAPGIRASSPVQVPGLSAARRLGRWLPFSGLAHSNPFTFPGGCGGTSLAELTELLHADPADISIHEGGAERVNSKVPSVRRHIHTSKGQLRYTGSSYLNSAALRNESNQHLLLSEVHKYGRTC